MTQKKELTHFDSSGRARMVDVSDKNKSAREATASGSIIMSKETYALIKEGRVKKGDVLTVADVAAVMGAKRTPELIPMCHPISLTGVSVTFTDGVNTEDGRVSLGVEVTAKCVGETGVEMEALTGTAIALLTIYDMCKSAEKGMTIGTIELLEKSGGKSGHYKKD